MSLRLEVERTEWYTADVEVEGLDEVLEKVDTGDLTDEEILLLFDTKDELYELADKVADIDIDSEHEEVIKCPELDIYAVSQYRGRYDDLCHMRNVIRSQEIEKEREGSING